MAFCVARLLIHGFFLKCRDIVSTVQLPNASSPDVNAHDPFNSPQHSSLLMILLPGGKIHIVKKMMSAHCIFIISSGAEFSGTLQQAGSGGHFLEYIWLCRDIHNVLVAPCQSLQTFIHAPKKLGGMLWKPNAGPQLSKTYTPTL